MSISRVHRAQRSLLEAPLICVPTEAETPREARDGDLYPTAVVALLSWQRLAASEVLPVVLRV